MLAAVWKMEDIGCEMNWKTSSFPLRNRSSPDTPLLKYENGTGSIRGLSRNL